MKRQLWVIAIMVLTSCEQARETSEPEKIVERFMASYKQDGPKKALGTLLPTNKYITRQDADSVAVRLERLTSGLGNFHGHEKIRESTYGKGVTHLTYIIKYTRQPLRFNFRFYRPAEEWTILNFSYEVDFLNELEETAKPARLQENAEQYD